MRVFFSRLVRFFIAVGMIAMFAFAGYVGYTVGYSTAIHDAEPRAVSGGYVISFNGVEHDYS